MAQYIYIIYTYIIYIYIYVVPSYIYSGVINVIPDIFDMMHTRVNVKDSDSTPNAKSCVSYLTELQQQTGSLRVSERFIHISILGNGPLKQIGHLKN
jgi:hypothetical protein